LSEQIPECTPKSPIGGLYNLSQEEELYNSNFTCSGKIIVLQAPWSEQIFECIYGKLID
jgi:hypothetical protein